MTAEPPDVVEVYSAANALEAHFLKNELESAGISAPVVGHVLGAAGGGLPLGESTSPRIWVQHADEPRARQWIEEWQRHRSGHRGHAENVWICPRCGKKIDAKLAVCWNCGTTPGGTPDPDFAMEQPP